MPFISKTFYFLFHGHKCKLIKRRKEMFRLVQLLMKRYFGLLENYTVYIVLKIVN